MQEFAVYGQAAAPGTMRLWVGFRAHTTAKVVGVWVNDAPVPILFDREIGPVLHATPTDFFSCVLRVEGVRPGWHWASVRLSDGRGLRVPIRVLPPQLAKGETLRVLMGSCFHRETSQPGIFDQFLRTLAPAARPDLTLLMGDQVYLDLPADQAFPDEEVWLSRQFQEAYRRNWFEQFGLSTLLGVAPAVCSPDDHEYWNNYPEPATVIQNSWSKDGRERWARPASQLYDAFQRPVIERDGVTTLRVAPLSLCVVDLRSRRSIEKRRFYDMDHATGELAAVEQTRRRVEQWLEGLGPEEVGVLVTGQSLLDEPAGGFKGRVADYALADYAESYEALIRAVETAARRIAGMVLLTGDVHWSRVTSVREHGVPLVHEVISSPMSLVRVPLVDRVKELAGTLSRDPWPRHRAPPDPAKHFARPVLANRYESHKVGGQKGNRVALLEFTPRADRGCSLTVRSYELRAPFSCDVTNITLNRVF